MTDRIDLHVHTTASDGTCTPAEVAELAAGLGLRAIAVTDHDTEDGCAEAAAMARELGLELVPGIELSTVFHAPIHILGYYADSERMRGTLDWIVRDRDERNEKVCARMREDGLPVEYAALQARFGTVVGRPHFARILMEYGLADSVQDAFQRYVGKGMRYYERRHFLSTQEAIRIIREAGGIPVLAHPFQYRLDDDGLRELLHAAVDAGLRGMECRYSGYTDEQSTYLTGLAGEYGLLCTGGSDFHGANKPHIALGGPEVPYGWLERMKDELWNR